ncbi:CesT family type III secretion system chaperone [Breoghania sp. JC706]|uniref:CesT family type III secretion system chaperone n=1 Tax=Breoghania sp. JC706 TaxID=3117732 RepID=UPI00300AAA41
MERPVFEKLIRDFWSHLALDAPVFDADDEVVLEVDDLDVTLRPGDDDETLVIEMHVGRLSQDETTRRAELEKILKLNFALSPARDTLTVLEPETGGAGTILARGFYRTPQRDFARLADLVADVISTGETLRMIVADDRLSPHFAGGPGRGGEPAADADLLILKP